MLIRYTGNRTLDYNLSIVSEFEKWLQKLWYGLMLRLYYMQIHRDRFVKDYNKRKKNVYTSQTIYVNK